MVHVVHTGSTMSAWRWHVLALRRCSWLLYVMRRDHALLYAHMECVAVSMGTFATPAARVDEADLVACCVFSHACAQSCAWTRAQVAKLPDQNELCQIMSV